MKKYCTLWWHKSSAEQIPQSKLISIIRVQVNKLQVPSQRVVSCKPKCCELEIYHIASQRVMSLSHCDLLAIKHVSYKPAAYELPAFKLKPFKAASQPK